MTEQEPAPQTPHPKELQPEKRTFARNLKAFLVRVFRRAGTPNETIRQNILGQIRPINQVTVLNPRGSVYTEGPGGDTAFTSGLILADSLALAPLPGNPDLIDSISPAESDSPNAGRELVGEGPGAPNELFGPRFVQDIEEGTFLSPHLSQEGTILHGYVRHSIEEGFELAGQEEDDPGQSQEIDAGESEGQGSQSGGGFFGALTGLFGGQPAADADDDDDNGDSDSDGDGGDGDGDGGD